MKTNQRFQLNQGKNQAFFYPGKLMLLVKQHQKSNQFKVTEKVFADIEELRAAYARALQKGWVKA